MACELLVAACMWDLVPSPGIEPVSSALEGGFLTTAPLGKSLAFSLDDLKKKICHTKGVACACVQSLKSMAFADKLFSKNRAKGKRLGWGWGNG